MLRRAWGAEAAGARTAGGACAVARCGAAARACLEHHVHARDSPDVPVQGLVEAGSLPGVERGEARDAPARMVAEAAGCRQGGRLVCGGAMGQRPGLTMNINHMVVTCATFQSRG